MKIKFSKHWKSSTQPRKQRKYRFSAPLHIMRKFTVAHLSKELRTKYGKRNISLRKGDSIKIMRGKFKGRIGKVERINLKKTKVYVSEIQITKKDGSKAFYPIHPSNLLITEIILTDKKRQNKLLKIKTRQD